MGESDEFYYELKVRSIKAKTTPFVVHDFAGRDMCEKKLSDLEWQQLDEEFDPILSENVMYLKCMRLKALPEVAFEDFHPMGDDVLTMVA